MNQDSLLSNILSVSQLIEQVQTQLAPLNPIIVQGEIASHMRSGLGHQYFELKDDKAKIRCVIFKGSVRELPPLQNGLLVKINARANVYGPQGSLQLKVDRLEPLGDGLLQIRFEKIKKKLAAEGLFDEERKRPLPPYPERVILITSENAAAYHDVCKTLKLTWPCLHLLFLPVTVQGVDSVRDIVNALHYTRQPQIYNNYDLILLVRGGGSLDDLWSFNEEAVVRTCASLKLPLVTGIGHEIDFTLCDLIADYRGATPTAAAAAISPGRDWLGKHIQELSTASTRTVVKLWQENQSQLELLRAGLHGQSPKNEIDRLRQNIDLWQATARQKTSELLWEMQEKSQSLKHKILHHHPINTIERGSQRLRALSQQGRELVMYKARVHQEHFNGLQLALAGVHPARTWDRASTALQRQQLLLESSRPTQLWREMKQRIRSAEQATKRGGRNVHLLLERWQERLSFLKKQLHQNHPDKILGRGYALITDDSGAIIKRKADALKRKYLNIELSDGRFRAQALPDSKDSKDSKA